MKYLLDNQESDRLRFRLLQDSDFDTWQKFFGYDDVNEFLHLSPDDTPEQQCKGWFQKVYERYQHDQGGMNVLIDKRTNAFVGQCGLLVQEVDGVQELEIGYSILDEFRGKSYATEAAQKCRDYAFENDFAESLISIVHVDNLPSTKVAIKNGMISTHQTTFKDSPVNIFRIDRSEWLRIYT